MKKFLLLTAVLAMFSQNIDAKSVTVEQAMAIAQRHCASTPTMMKSGANAKMELNYVARGSKGTNDFYVFNRQGNQGFVIVAGDDVSTPILGYSDKGAFDINKAPETLRLLLEEYQRQMEWMRHNPQKSNAPRLNYDLQPYGVAPILGDVHWWQGAPYNSNLPTASNMPSDCLGHCYAGCAAAALAQILKAFRHPYHGYGENSYTWTVDGREWTMASNFANHNYRYSQMRTGYGPTSTSTGVRDVAELFYDVDVALNMRFYGDNGSDAYIRDIVKALIAYFDYNPGMQYLLKSNYAYNEEAWNDMIYAEIDGGRPVYYLGYRTIDNSGNSCEVGHAFVLDGYDRNGKVHVNWGFQPEEYNTYFELNMLSPRMYTAEGYGEFDVEKSGFNAKQSMIIGICPDTTGVGGVVVKNVNLVAEQMPANDVRATIEVQALNGPYSGSLKYGIVTKDDEGYHNYYTFTDEVSIDENGIATLDVSGSYDWLYNGRTYYIVVWSPYFSDSYNWFLAEPVPFTIGDWVTPPDPQFILGDVNGDGVVNITDATMLIGLILDGDPLASDYPAGDMNEDGVLNVSDVNLLINQALTGE